MANIHSQPWRCYRGEDTSIVLTGADNTNPTGWALLLTISTRPGGTAVLSSTSVTVGGINPYTLTAALTRAQTAALTSSRYFWDVWRTTSGSNWRLAGGFLDLDTPVRPLT